MRFALALLMACQLALAGEPVRIVFDTDIGNDIDDALALALFHALESRGEARLLAVTITKDCPLSAPYVSLINAFYRRPDIPVGVVKNGKTPDTTNLLRVPVERKDPDGKLIYPRRIPDGRKAPDATELLRRILAAQPESSVSFVQVGFSTNLARLLDSAPDRHSPLNGRDLVAAKARLLSVMAGQYPTGNPEYNVKVDIPAAKKVFAGWPTPIVASGLELGGSILYPSVSIERDYGYVAHHPIADGYRAYKKMPYDRPTWDVTSALYAVRPGRGYFSLSPPGRIVVDAHGRTKFEAVAGGKHRYLIANETERARALEAMVQLASQPPK